MVQSALAVGLLIWLIVIAHAMVSTNTPPSKPGPRWLRVLAFVGMLGLSIGLGVAGFIWNQSEGISSYTVMGEAAAPNLLKGDRVIVNRSTYKRRDPKRGEMVVFRMAHDHDGVYPISERPHAPQVTYAMRIVGLPRDKVSVRRGTVYINQKPIQSSQTQQTFIDKDGRRLAIYQQNIGEHAIQFAVDKGITTRDVPITVVQKSIETPAQVLEKGHYFLMGDNRSYAIDSRFWGTVPREDLIGPAIRIYASYDEQANSVRWDRIGQLIN